MNREVLKNLFTENRDHYANDALQAICSRICQFDNYKMQNMIEWERENKQNHPELPAMSKNMYLMTSLFDKIVEQGQEFALAFIEINKGYLNNG